jgi:glutamate formiminotransferase
LIPVSEKRSEFIAEVIEADGLRYLKVPKQYYAEFQTEHHAAALLWTIMASGYKEFKNMNASEIIPEAPWKNQLQDERINLSRDLAQRMGINVPRG